MNCAECKELLIAYFEGLLSKSQKQTIKEHLKCCRNCLAEARELANLHDRLVKNGDTLARTNLEDEVMTQIVREQHARLKTTHKFGAGPKLRSIIMKSPITRIAAAAVIIIAVYLGVNRFFSGSVTFADVIKPILNARSVAFDFIVGEEKTGPVIHDIVVGNRIRRTFSTMDTILILDLDNSRMLTLDPKSKGAMYIDIEGTIQEGTKNMLGLVRDIVSDIEKHPEWPVREISQKEIDGQKATGFRVCGSNAELTIWANADTAKLVRIELLFGKSSTIIKNIEFDVPVDESLVSMEPPADYVLGSMEYKLNQFTEEDFIESLHIWARFMQEGRFPDTLVVEDLLRMPPLLGEKLGRSGLSQEEATRIAMTFVRGLTFLQVIETNGCEWHYAGKGVELGDSEAALFWYQPKDSKTYRVIYGDLSVEDVLPENLPR
jgi:hypothetical protein